MSPRTGLSQPVLNKIVRTIHAEPELDGCVVGYSHGGAHRVIHKGKIPTRNALEKLVIVEYAPVAPGTVKLKTVPTQPRTTQTLPPYKQNISQLGPELIGLGCSLMCFTFSAMGTAAGAAATPLTGPAGVAVGVACWTGLVTSGVQAANGILRFWKIALDPYGNQLQQMDADERYQTFILAVDAAGVVVGVQAAAAGGMAIWKVIRMRSTFKSATPASLAAMDKASRERVLTRAYKEITSTPQGTKEMNDALRSVTNAAGKTTKISVAGVGKARHAGKVAGVISQVAQSRLQRSLAEQLLKDAVGPGFSALPGIFAGSASGAVNKFLTDPAGNWLAGALSVHVVHQGGGR